MIIKGEQVEIIQNYLDKISKIEKDEFMPGLEEIKEKISKKMSYNVSDKVHEVRECVVPNEKDIQDKITDLMDELLDDYHYEVHSYVKKQHDVVSDLTKNLGEGQYELDQGLLVNAIYENKKYEDMELDKNVVNKMVTRVCTHIGFRNQSNPNYYKKSNEIEEFVRSEITSKMKLFKENVDELYEYVLKELNEQKIIFLNTTLSFAETEKISANESAFIDEFAYEQSENARRFK